MDQGRRYQNERRYSKWIELPEGGRRYWYDVVGRSGWRARYVKEVDSGEETIRFYQEIYNERGILMENHQKYPDDTGHRRIHEE